MRLLLGSALLALACAGPAAALEQSQLAGTWVLDIDLFFAEMEKTQPEMAQLPAEQKQMMKDLMKGQMEKAQFTFGADGITHTGPDGQTRTTKPKSWTSTGPTTATVVTEDGGKEQSSQVELVDAGNLRMTVTQPDGKQLTMTFRPKKA